MPDEITPIAKKVADINAFILEVEKIWVEKDNE